MGQERDPSLSERDHDYIEEYEDAIRYNKEHGINVEEYSYDMYKAKITGSWYHSDIFGKVILDYDNKPIPEATCICAAWSNNECVCGAWNLE